MFAFRKMWNRQKNNFFSYQSTSMLCKSSLEASEVIIFCLTIVACDISVSFLNACYVGFGPVLFRTYEECKPLINLSASPQGHPQFEVFATPCCVHVAHGLRVSTRAEAFTPRLCWNHTVALIKAFTLLQSYSLSWLKMAQFWFLRFWQNVIADLAAEFWQGCFCSVGSTCITEQRFEVILGTE